MAPPSFAETALPISKETVPALPRWQRAVNRAFGWRTQASGAALAWPFPLTVLLLWQLASQFGWLPPQILPSPLTVAQTFGELFASGELREHTQISLQRMALGFVIGTTLGSALGILMGLSPY